MDLYKQTLEKFLRYRLISQTQLVALSNSSEPVVWQLILACIYRGILTTQLISKQISDLLLVTPQEHKTTQIRQLVNYAVWKLDSIDIQLKHSSTFLKILSEWVNVFQQLISKPQAEDCCFGHLLDFISKNTRTYLERVVFVQEIFDDIRGVINLQHFWEVYGEVELDELKTPVDNLNSLLGVLEIITFKSELVFKTQKGQEACLYNPLFDVLDSTQKYDEFVYRSICYIFIHKGMLAKVEKNLTLVVLRFITWTKKDKWSIHLIKEMINKTSSAVRFALSKDYQETFELLQHQKRFQLVENLQKIPSFRELIKKRVEAATLETHQHQRNQVLVNRGEQKSFYFEVTKPSSILFLEYYVDIDINVSLSFLGTMDQQSKNTYLQEHKSRGKSIQVLVNNCGLHSVTFDNNYSWLTSKNVVFSLNVFKPGSIDNDPFNLLVYPWEFTRWQGLSYQLTQQEKEFLQVWKSNVCQQSDVLFRNGKVFFQGRLSTLDKFTMTSNQMMSIKSVLVVEPQLEYGEWLSKIKAVNLDVKVRKCDQEDF